jgi:mono/diheme cytochrome c family protein
MSEQDKPNLDPAPAELPMPRLPRPPFWLISIALISVVATWLPLAVTGRARVTTTTDTRIQLMQDMGKQPKFNTQMSNSLFADGRAMRPRVEGTVPRGQLEQDDHFYRGFTRDAAGKVTFYDGFPSQIEVNERLLERGRQRFNIYCYVCHGLDGKGDGPVNERVKMLRDDNVTDIAWTAPQNLTDDRIRNEANGQIFNTITNGIRTMPSYGSQIPPSDRWAIISYVRALELSHAAPASVVPSGTAISEK